MFIAYFKTIFCKLKFQKGKQIYEVFCPVLTDIEKDKDELKLSIVWVAPKSTPISQCSSIVLYFIF